MAPPIVEDIIKSHKLYPPPILSEIINAFLWLNMTRNIYTSFSGWVYSNFKKVFPYLYFRQLLMNFDLL